MLRCRPGLRRVLQTMRREARHPKLCRSGSRTRLTHKSHASFACAGTWRDGPGNVVDATSCLACCCLPADMPREAKLWRGGCASSSCTKQASSRFVPRATGRQHVERQVGHTTHCECLHVHSGLFQGGLGCEHHNGYVFLLGPGREFLPTRLGPMILLRIPKDGAVFPPLWLSAGSYVSDTPSQSKHVRHPRPARSARSCVFGLPVAA